MKPIYEEIKKIELFAKKGKRGSILGLHGDFYKPFNELIKKYIGIDIVETGEVINEFNVKTQLYDGNYKVTIIVEKENKLNKKI